MSGKERERESEKIETGRELIQGSSGSAPIKLSLCFLRSAAGRVKQRPTVYMREREGEVT